MSTDNTRERAHSYGVRVGEALARQHTRDAQNILPVYADQGAITLATREAMIIGMWSAYLAYLAAHITSVVGADATRAMLGGIAGEVAEITDRGAPRTN